jgi:hypothetical protein
VISHFFIDRPIFATVLSVVLTLAAVVLNRAPGNAAGSPYHESP